MATNRGRSVSYTIAHLQHYAAGDCPRVRRLSLLRLSPNGLCVVALLLGAMPAPARASKIKLVRATQVPVSIDRIFKSIAAAGCAEPGSA